MQSSEIRWRLAPVQAWASPLPSWIEVKQVPNTPDDAALQSLGEGERAAIVLALSIQADLVLIDERKGTRAAIAKGLDATGTPRHFAARGTAWPAQSGGGVRPAQTDEFSLS